MSTTLATIRTLRAALEHTALTIATPSSLEATTAARRATRILDDHVIARLSTTDAPLLAVIGGSTGAGKSTILNTLVQQNLSVSSVVRPTTRHPVLVHRPEDESWFMNTTILPSFARVKRDGAPAPHHAGEPVHIELRAAEDIPAHLALLDAPDVDSVVEENRDLAQQMLDAADLWIFVTTAARYADAVPWQVLAPAALRGVRVAIVLNRIPEGASDIVSDDLRKLMSAQGIGEAEVFTIEEHPLTNNMLDRDDIRPLQEWLVQQADSQETRAQITQQAGEASVSQVLESSRIVLNAFEEQQRLLTEARADIDEAFSQAATRLRVATADGSLLRGEVMSRWQDIVGAADFTRSLSRTVAFARDRLTHIVTGRPMPIEPVEDALEAGLAHLIEDELHKMSAQVRQRWYESTSMKSVLQRAKDDVDISTIAVDTARKWQQDLLELVRLSGASKRTMARFLAVGVNVVAVALMIVIFASTGGLTGVEVGVAGASAALSQKLLEAVFGDQAVRTMTKRAQEMLIERLEAATQQVMAPLREAIDEVSVDAEFIDEEGKTMTLAEAIDQVKLP